MEYGDCAHLSLWEKALKYHCDSIVLSSDPEEGSMLLRELAISLEDRSPPSMARLQSTLKSLLAKTPVLWWAPSLGVESLDLTAHQASAYLQSDRMPTKIILGWTSLHTIIRYYPSHFIVFALEHLDRKTSCPAPLSEEHLLGVAAAVSKIPLVYISASNPLPITPSVLREVCRLGKWKSILSLLLPVYLEEGPVSKAHSLIHHIFDCPYEIFSFLLEAIPRESWRTFPDLLVSFVRFGPEDPKGLVKSLSKLLLRVNPEGEEPLGRLEALKDACTFGLVGVLKVLLKSPTYPSDTLEEEELHQVYPVAISANAHECIAYLRDLHPDKTFGESEVDALLSVSRATQVMCYNEELIEDFGMAIHLKLERLISILTTNLKGSQGSQGSQALHSTLLFLTRILVKHLELFPTHLSHSSIYPLFLSLMDHQEVGHLLTPRLAHLFTPPFTLKLSLQAPHHLEALGLDPPLHLWTQAKTSLRELYLFVQGQSSNESLPPLGLFPKATLDFYSHVRKVMDGLGRFDPRRIGCLWKGSPFITRRCALESLRTYRIQLWSLEVFASKPSLDCLWECKRSRFLSASSKVKHGAKKGDPSRASMTVSMLDLDSSKTFSLHQVLEANEDAFPEAQGVEEEISQWVGKIPSNTNIHLGVKGLSLPKVYFLSIHSVLAPSLGWTASKFPRSSLRARPARSRSLGSRSTSSMLAGSHRSHGNEGQRASGSSRESRGSRERRSPRRGQPPYTIRR